MSYAIRSSRVVAILAALLGSQALIAQAALPDTPETRRAEWLARSPFNETAAPNGALLHSGGGTNGPEYDEWNQRIETHLAPSEVVEHYRAVFGERGWRIGTPVVDGSVAMASGHTGLNGGDQHVLIMAAGSVVDPNRVVLMLRLTKLLPP